MPNNRESCSVSMGRLSIIDAAKGIGICLVVLGHTQEPKLMTLIIYSFHMPLFFLLAGYTFDPKKYSIKTIWTQKAQSFLLPYLLSGIIFYSLWLLVGRHLSNVSPFLAFLGILYGNADMLEVNVILWFLTAIFTSEIVFFSCLEL